MESEIIQTGASNDRQRESPHMKAVGAAWAMVFPFHTDGAPNARCYHAFRVMCFIRGVESGINLTTGHSSASRPVLLGKLMGQIDPDTSTSLCTVAVRSAGGMTTQMFILSTAATAADPPTLYILVARRE